MLPESYPDSYYYKQLTSPDSSIRMKSVGHLHAQYKYLIKTFCIHKRLDQSKTDLLSDLEAIYNQIIADLYLKIHEREFTAGVQQIKSRIFFLINKRFLDLKRKSVRRLAFVEVEEGQVQAEESESIKEIELRKLERIDKVRTALKMLEGNHCTEILSRYFLKKEKLKDIAIAIKQEYGTVRNKIGKCKGELVKILEERFDFKKDNLWT